MGVSKVKNTVNSSSVVVSKEVILFRYLPQYCFITIAFPASADKTCGSCNVIKSGAAATSGG